MKEVQIKELRIGNYLNRALGVGFFEVTLEDLQIIESGSKCTPIPLTEEWLLKFGFVKDFEYDNLYYNTLNVTNGFTTIEVDVKHKICLIDNMEVVCEYVHQLQNLYFALTNEDLRLIVCDDENLECTDYKTACEKCLKAFSEYKKAKQ